MTKKLTLILVSLLFGLTATWSVDDSHVSTTDAQGPASFSYDILPGIQDPANGQFHLFAPTDVTLTQGWHYGARNGLDLAPAWIGRPVHLALRANDPSAQVFGQLREGSNPNGCRFIAIDFYETEGGVDEHLGSVTYLHTRPEVSALANPAVAMPASEGAVFTRHISTLLDTSWTPVPNGRNDTWSTRISEEINRLVAAGSLEVSSSVGAPQSITVYGNTFQVRNMFGVWYEQKWREALGEPRPTSADGPRCASTGPHLHQEADLVGTSLWRNIDRARNLEDNGFGFTEGNAYQQFCSDTWLVRLQSSTTAPQSTPVVRCGAPKTAPSALSAISGDSRISLTWNMSEDSSIAHYRYRIRISSATTETTNPWGDGWKHVPNSNSDTTSLTIPGLTNGVSYTIQLQSANANGGSPPATTSLALLAPPTIHTPSTTSSSITLNWGKVTGATSYDLKQFAFGGNCDGPGGNGHTSLLTFTFTQGLTASTNYIVCVQARNLQGTSAWASTPARTLAAPVQPPIIVPIFTYTTLSFDVGLSPNITWPGHTVGIASALAIRPVDRAYWWNSDTQAWNIYVVAGPTFLQMFTQLRTGEIYIFNATETFTWRIRNANSSARAATRDEATSDADTGSYDRSSGWWSIVTCDSGIAPIEFGGVTSEQEATSNAQWFVASEIGCNGHGSFVLEFVE